VTKELVYKFEQDLNEHLDSFEVYALSQILAIPDSLVLSEVRNKNRFYLCHELTTIVSGSKTKTTKTKF
jgi:hypothetical protein